MSRKPNQFEEQARIAHTYDLPKDHQRVEHKDNILVYNFLLFAPPLCAATATHCSWTCAFSDDASTRFMLCREVAEKLESEGRHEDGVCRNSKKACGSVQCCVRRIYDKKCLESLKFVGPALANKVQHSLWAQFPPAPPSEEEQHAWAQASQSSVKVCHIGLAPQARLPDITSTDNLYLS